MMQKDQDVVSFRLSRSKLDHQRIASYIEQGKGEFGSSAEYIRRAILFYEDCRKKQELSQENEIMEQRFRKILHEEMQMFSNRILEQCRKSTANAENYDNKNHTFQPEEELDAAFQDTMIDSMFEDC